MSDHAKECASRATIRAGDIGHFQSPVSETQLLPAQCEATLSHGAKHTKNYKPPATPALTPRNASAPSSVQDIQIAAQATSTLHDLFERREHARTAASTPHKFCYSLHDPAGNRLGKLPACRVAAAVGSAGSGHIFTPITNT